MSPFRAAAILVFALTGPCLAQPKTGEVQPDRLDFGTIYPGAIVEASFMVFERGLDKNIELSVAAPPFVKVLNKETHAQQFGAGNDFICGSIEIAMDVAKVGEVQGEISVTLGQTTVRVPVRATIAACQPGQPRLLIVATPFQRYSTKDGTAFKPWTDLATQAKADVSYLLARVGNPVLRDLDLSTFHCVFLADTGLAYLTPQDIQRARAYAQGGGRVVVAANYFMRGTTGKANAVLEDYGLQIRDEEAGGQGIAAVTIGKDGLDQMVIDAGVQSIKFFRASPISILVPARSQALVKAMGVGNPTDGFVARARARKGEVIAIGQSLWWDWIGEARGAGSDNGKLLSWLLMPPRGS